MTMPLALYVMNVGQGQCVVLINSNPASLRAAIVDAGTDGRQLAKWLKNVGVRQIPAVVLTHNHDDHIRGATDLVEAFAGKVGKIYYVIDQPPTKIPIWLPIQQWLEKEKIAAAVKVCPEDTAGPTHGKALLPRGLDGFQLYCVYPTEIELAGVAVAAPLLGTHPGANNPNAASAILRLVRSADPDKSVALLGGDMTFRGWQRLHERNCDLASEVLVVPHHGSGKGATAAFGPHHLAQAVKPEYALFSVGTDNNYGHPAAEVVKELRVAGARVLCTQITPQCHANPASLPGGVAPDPANPKLASGGVPCAGTIMVKVPDAGAVDVVRLSDHQNAVDSLTKAPVCTLCRR